MSWLIINDADDSVASGPVDVLPDPLAEATHAVVSPLTYGTDVIWSPGVGFVLVAPPPLLTVGRFMLLLTQAERIAIRQAASQSPEIEDFLDLLRGFTDGVSLNDPVLVLAIGQLETAGLLTSDRATAVLAGEAP